MHHSFLDQYSDLESPIHSWDARLKVITFAIAVFAVVSLPTGRFIAICTYLALLLGCWVVSDLPLSHLLRRTALILPFVLMMSLSAAWLKFHADGEQPLSFMTFIMLRAAGAVLALTLLTSTTPFPTLLASLQWLKAPGTILSLMSFLYSFIYILIDEFERLNTGRRSRDFGSGICLAWRSRAWMLGTFLIRSMERSERVYQAMAARGYDGEMQRFSKLKQPSTKQVSITAMAIAAIVLIRLGVTR